VKKGHLIARGRTAEVFQCGNNRILKLFLDRNRATDAEREAQNTRLVYDAGLPVPSVGSIVEVDGRPGIVFEHIEGPSMMAILSSKPWKVIAFARWLAELQIQMHSCKVPELPSQRKRLEKHIRVAAPLRGDVKEVVIRTLEILPDGDAVCHGDFHPANIIVSARGPIIIDWLDATRGNPIADLARTGLLLRLSELPHGTGKRLLISSFRALFHTVYLRRYAQLQPIQRQQLQLWNLPVMAGRLHENIPEREKRRLLGLVQAALQH